MTIPSREQALEILDSIPSDYQQVDELKSWLRSYIESHTGEPVAHEWHERFGLTCCKVCGLVRNENSDTKGCRGPVYVSLRDASPVQPVLEWEPKGRLGNFGHRQLIFNGKVIGTYRKTTGYIGQPRADELEVMAGRNCKGDFLRQAPFLDWQTEADIEANMEQRARQWLSAGDK